MFKPEKIIFFLFNVLLFFVPIVLWPYTSEVFEFNKMVLTYALTTLIFGLWVTRSVIDQKIAFRRTILDIPLLTFIGSQFISTILSIDPRTSIFGYYSRFNGGLLSTICYSILYWAFVSNIKFVDLLKTLKVFLFSAVLVSLYGVTEHFGIDKNIWVQDVQSRVFSTLGQPNWLAAWLVALMPISWALMIKEKKFSFNFWLYFGYSILFFWTLIFTKSRSGFLGFVVAGFIFWGKILWSERKNFKNIIRPIIFVAISVIAICLISGTQWTPSIESLLTHKTPPQTNTNQGPALETGGTESGVIRQIVWKGAIDVWMHYPIFGTGVETFADSYYQFRPKEHNLVSEWDFIYNKAHNEFLNVAANSGTVGLLSYLTIIGVSLYIFWFAFKSDKIISIALAAGFISLSATNFFGFSVVPTQLEFFLFPAFAIALIDSQFDEKKAKKFNIGTSQYVMVFVTGILTIMFLIFIGKYWAADYFYSLGKDYADAKRADLALQNLDKALNLEPNEPLYHNELATVFTSISLGFDSQKNSSEAAAFANKAITESEIAVTESPANLNYKRTRFGIFIMLSALDPNYIFSAQAILLDAIKYAPTDAKLFYNLALTYARTNQMDLAISTLQKTIDLKANYKEARLAYAYLLIDRKNISEAKKQLEYILTNIDPTDALSKQALESIK